MSEELENFNAVSTPPDEGTPRYITSNIEQDIEAYFNNTFCVPSPPKEKNPRLRAKLPKAVL